MRPSTYCSHSSTMDVSATGTPWVCVAIFVLTTVVLVIRSRNASWVYDIRLQLNAQPRLTTVLAAVMVIVMGAVFAVIFGIGFLQVGYSYGWASSLSRWLSA